MFYIELVWNREFHWSGYGAGYKTQEAALTAARTLLNMGDGASVKKVRIVDGEGNVVVPYVNC